MLANRQFWLGMLIFSIALACFAIFSSEGRADVITYYPDAANDVINTTAGLAVPPDGLSSEMDIVMMQINETYDGLNITLTCNTTIPSSVAAAVSIDRDCDGANDLMFAGSAGGAMLYEFYLNQSYFMPIFFDDKNVSMFIPIENISNINRVTLQSMTIRNIAGMYTWMDFTERVTLELSYPRIFGLEVALVQRGDLDGESDGDDIVVRVGSAEMPFMQGFYVAVEYFNDPSGSWHAGGMFANDTTDMTLTTFYDLQPIIPNFYKVVAFKQSGEFIGSFSVFEPLGMTFSGYVLDEDTGMPIEGANVTISNSYIDAVLGGPQTIFTNASGWAYIKLVNTTYNVHISKYGYNTASFNIFGTTSGTIYLTKRPWILKGFIKDDLGTPIEFGHVYVTVKDLPNIYEGEEYSIGPGGYYEIPIDKESYYGINLLAMVEGYYPFGKEIAYGEMADVMWANMTMKPLPREGSWLVRGFVRTPSLTGVAAYVAFVDLAHSYSTGLGTDSTGYYEFVTYPSNFIMMIFSNGYYRTITSVNVLPSDNVVWCNVTVHPVITDITMMRYIDGLVADDYGTPIEGAQVAVWNEDDRYFADNDSSKQYSALTDAYGKFNISMPEGRYLLIVTKAMLASNISYVVDLSLGNVSSLDVTLHSLPMPEHYMALDMLTWSYGTVERIESVYSLGAIDSNYFRWLFEMSYGNNDHYVNETESAIFSSIMEENFGNAIVEELEDKEVMYIDGTAMRMDTASTAFEMSFTGEISSCRPIQFRISCSMTSAGFIIPNKSCYNISIYISGVSDSKLNITLSPPAGYLMHSYICPDYNITGAGPIEISGNGTWYGVEVTLGFADVVPPILVAQTSVEVDEDMLHYFDASQSSDNSAEGIVRYNWTVSNSSCDIFHIDSSNASYLPYTFDLPGGYTIALAIYDLAGNCNITTISVNVRDKEPPNVVISTPSLVVDEDAHITFDSLSTDNYQIVSLTWDFGDGTLTATGASVSHAFDDPGTYTVRLTVSDGANANFSTITIIVRDITKPSIALIVPFEVDEDATFILDASATTDNDVLFGATGSFVWTIYDYNGTFTKSGRQVAYAFAQPGTYQVSINVSDAAGNWNLSTTSIVVNDRTPPVANISTDSFVFDEDAQVLFSALNSTDNVGISIYEWSFGDLTGTYFGAEQYHSYATPGAYTVTLVVRDAALKNDSASVVVMVRDITKPSVSISAPPQVDEDTTFILDASTTTDNDPSFAITGVYSWTITDQDGTHVMSGKQATYMFDEPGIYQIAINVSDSSSNWNETTIMIVVNDRTPPTANISADMLIFDEDVPVLFSATNSTDNVGIVDYIWNFGDATGTYTGANVSHRYDNPGVYLVTLIVKDGAGLDASSSLLVTVNDVTDPLASIASSASANEGEPVVFSASGCMDNVGIVAYDWSFGDGSAHANGSQVVHTFDLPGTYTVALTVTDGAGNAASTTFNITIRDATPPVANITADMQIFDEDVAVNFSAFFSYDNICISSYTWTFGDNTGEFVGMNVSHAFEQPGTYDVALVVKDNEGLSNVATLQVTVLDATVPRVSIVVVSSAPEDTPIVFYSTGSEDNVGIFEYDWDFGDGSAHANGSQVIHSYEQPGTYPINLTIYDKEGNSNFTIRNIEIRDVTPPSNSFVVPSEVNEDVPVLFSAKNSTDNVAIVNWSWDFDASDGIDNRDASGEEVDKAFANPGTFTVTLRVVDAAGNMNTTQRTIVVKDVTAPTAYAGGAQSATTGKKVIFNASGSSDNVAIVSYDWDFGDGKTASGKDAAHAYSKPGKYTVTLTVKDAQGLEGKTSIVVDVTSPAQDMRPFYALAGILVVGALIGGIVGVRAYRKWKLGGFKVEDAFLIYHDGRMIGHKSARKEELDSDVVAGMLVAVESFIGDTFAGQYGKSGKVGKLEWSGKKILIKKGEKFSLAVVIEGYDWESLHGKISQAASDIESEFGEKLANWDGDSAGFEGAGEILGKLLISEGVIKAEGSKEKTDK